MVRFSELLPIHGADSLTAVSNLHIETITIRLCVVKSESPQFSKKAGTSDALN